MDAVRNPFAPGAGSQPPELVGRDDIIENANIATQRIKRGRNVQHQIMLGLRGVGKTVLLNRIENIADDHDHFVSFIEAPDDRKLAELLYPKIHNILRNASLVEKAKTLAHNGMRTLQSFASVFKVKIHDVSISVDPLPGNADSGNLEEDLTSLFQIVGKTVQASGRAWTLLIDEIQYLKNEELSALIVALHRANQKNLPILFFGAGLPQIAALSGNAKSYAERLFIFQKIAALDKKSSKLAIREPIEEEDERINDNALNEIVKQTKGYPYFLQEWGYQVWNVAEKSPFTLRDVQIATKKAFTRLDEGFFKVRYDRLTPKEREYILAMAKLGQGPYRSADVAHKLGEDIKKLGPVRAKIIHKGMIYSPEHGDIDFTVPLFADFLKRKFL